MDDATVIVDRMVPALVSRSYEGDGLMPVLFPSVTVDPERISHLRPAFLQSTLKSFLRPRFATMTTVVTRTNFASDCSRSRPVPRSTSKLGFAYTPDSPSVHGRVQTVRGNQISSFLTGPNYGDLSCRKKRPKIAGRITNAIKDRGDKEYSSK